MRNAIAVLGRAHLPDLGRIIGDLEKKSVKRFPFI
jgi:hypothetical protein